MDLKEKLLSKVKELCETKKWNLSNKFIENFAVKTLPAFEAKDDKGELVDFDKTFSAYEFTIEQAYHAMTTGLSEQSERMRKEAEEAALKKITPQTPPDPVKPIVQTGGLTEEQQKQLDLMANYIKSQQDAESLKTLRVAVRGKVLTGINDEDYIKKFDAFYAQQAIDVTSNVEENAEIVKGNFREMSKLFMGENLQPFDAGGSRAKIEDLIGSLPKVEIK